MATALLVAAAQRQTLAQLSTDEAFFRGLARELARDIFDQETILKNFSLSEEAFLKIAVDDRFIKLFEEEKNIWSESPNTRERIEVKTLTMLEESLPAMAELLNNEKESATARVNLLQTLGKMVGLGRDTTGVTGPDNKIAININFGDKKVEVGAPRPLTIDQSGNEAE